jgi:hypothetical protein
MKIIVHYRYADQRDTALPCVAETSIATPPGYENSLVKGYVLRALGGTWAEAKSNLLDKVRAFMETPRLFVRPDDEEVNVTTRDWQGRELTDVQWP